MTVKKKSKSLPVAPRPASVRAPAARPVQPDAAPAGVPSLRSGSLSARTGRVSVESGERPGGMTVAERQRKSREDRKKSGLSRIELFVHADDVESIKVYAANLAKKRLKKV